MNQLEKNKIISDAIRATRLKRKSQACKVFKFKVNRSALSNEQKNSLKMFFVEAKRVYNYIIGNKLDPFNLGYKELKEITYLDKDKNQINYKIQYIGTSVIADTITLIKESIKGLSSSKKNGKKIVGLIFEIRQNYYKYPIDDLLDYEELRKKTKAEVQKLLDDIIYKNYKIHFPIAKTDLFDKEAILQTYMEIKKGEFEETAIRTPIPYFESVLIKKHAKKGRE